MLDSYKRRTIETKSGPQRGTFQEIDPNRLLIRVAGKNEIPPGAAVSRFGKKWHVCKHGLYDAWRQHLLIRRAGSAVNGELESLLSKRYVISEYIDGLLHTALLSPDDIADCRTDFSNVVSSLGWANDPFKRTAFFNLLRGLQEQDSRGRMNRPAAAMAAGAGLGRLLERSDHVCRILRHIGFRTFELHRAIVFVERMYTSLFEAVGGHRIETPRVTPVLWQFALDPSAAQRPSVIASVEGQLESFAHVYAEPFRNNAHHLRKDLNEALALLRDRSFLNSPQRQDALRVLFMRIREGSGWAIVLHCFEMEIRTPFSLLNADRKREARALKRASGDWEHSSPSPVVMSEQVRMEYAEIVRRVTDFGTRVDLCSDEYLTHPVKAEVLAHLEQSLEFARAEDWDEVDNEFEIVSGLL